MAIKIIRNMIDDDERYDFMHDVVSEAGADVSPEWGAYISEVTECPTLRVELETPDGRRWFRTFGPKEQSPEFIREKLREAIGEL